MTKQAFFKRALLLGAPVVWHAFKCLIQGHSHMDELAALAGEAELLYAEGYTLQPGFSQALIDEDLFTESGWELFGLSRQRLLISGALTGALAGSLRFSVPDLAAPGPGTLSVDIVGDYLYIHWVDVQERDTEAASRRIAASFEKFLEVIFG